MEIEQLYFRNLLEPRLVAVLFLYHGTLGYPSGKLIKLWKFSTRAHVFEI